MRTIRSFAFILALTALSAGAQCVTEEPVSNGWGDTIGVQVGSGWTDSSVIQQGMSMWSDCPSYGSGFADFWLNTSGDVNVTINLVSGQNPNPNGGCGGGQLPIDQTTGRITGGTITLYTRSGATNSPCDASWAETVAHELGHVLGLGDSTCDNWIMGRNQDPQTAGQRSVQSGECFAANQNWDTATEEPTPPPTDPYLDGYTCVGEGGCSPIVINLANGGYALTGQDDPVSFDLDADGTPSLYGWTAANADEAFLALDRNLDGIIGEGTELFGTVTPLLNGLPAGNGFRALQELDSNADGRIDAKDPVWRSLVLWHDRNHDGISQANEITAMAASEVLAIQTGAHLTNRRDASGNVFKYESLVTLRGPNGKEVTRPVYDVTFVQVLR